MISHGVSWACLDSFMPQRRLHSENWKINHLSHTYNKSLKSDRVRSWYCILTAYHIKWNCGFRFTLWNSIITQKILCDLNVDSFIFEFNRFIQFIELTARTRGQPRDPDSQIGSLRTPFADLSRRCWRPFSRPRLQPSDFFPIQVTFKNRPNFGPSTNQLREASQSTLGRHRADLGFILYTFEIHFWCRFLSYV